MITVERRMPQSLNTLCPKTRCEITHGRNCRHTVERSDSFVK